MLNSKFVYYLPILLLGMLWLIILGLYSLNPYNFIRVSHSTLFILVIGILSIILGYIYVHAFKYDDYLLTTEDKARNNIIYTDVSIKTSIIITTLLGITGAFITILWLANTLGGMRIYELNPLLVRQASVEITKVGSFTMYPVYTIGTYLINFLFIGNILSGLYFGKKWILYKSIPLVVSFIISGLLLQRMIIVTSFGLLFLSSAFSIYLLPYQQRRKISIPMTGAVLIIFCLLIGISYVIIKVRMFYLNNIFEIFLKSTYTYLVGTVSSLEMLLRKEIDYTYGEQSFRTIFKWLARLGFIQDFGQYKTHLGFVNIGRMHINTYTFVRSLYMDYGIIGLTFVGFFWGALTRIIIGKFQKEYTLSYLFWAVILTFSLLMSFYEFYFQGISRIIYWYLLVYLVEKLFLRPVNGNTMAGYEYSK